MSKMNRRQVLGLMAATGMGALNGGCLSGPRNAQAPPRKKPNVLFVAIDDLNHWVGYLGRNPQTKTPNIDRLAARGVSFTRSYCAAPVCNPSRAAVMSGLRPSTSGVYQNQNDWRTVIPEDLTLTTAFRKGGYYVCGSGKIYHDSFRRRSEWDDYLEQAGEGGDPVPEGNPGVGAIKFGPLDCDDRDLREWKVVDYAEGAIAQDARRAFLFGRGASQAPSAVERSPKVLRSPSSGEH